ncbi:MAG: hypothetical protein U0794_02715 [Isosphaeraceae bacterium]
MQREAEARTTSNGPGDHFVTSEVSSRAGRHRPLPQRQGRRLRRVGPRAPERGKKSKDLAITEGSGAGPWWRRLAAVGTSPKWQHPFERLKSAAGATAIVAIARKFLGVLYAMLRTSTPYKILPAAQAA